MLFSTVLLILTPPRQDAHEGLESFSHFGLTKRQGMGGSEEDEDDCSVGSLTAAVGQDRGYGKMHSFASSANDLDQEENTMTRLNNKIHTLFLEWEKRRETAKERNQLEKQRMKKKDEKDEKSKASSLQATKATPHTSEFVTHIQNSCYKKKVALPTAGSKVALPATATATASGAGSSSYVPYPSQLRSLASLSSTRLAEYIANRAKTRLSRKSERVLSIGRMKGTEKAFHSRRLTYEQMRVLLDAIEGADERQHAALLFIIRLTDIVEVASNVELIKKMELSFECEKRMQLVASILSAEAQAEDNLNAIHQLYVKCFSIHQDIKGVVVASRKEEDDADYVRLQSIQKLKDTSFVSPKQQNSLRVKLKDFKSTISLMRRAVSDVHTALNAGFTVHLTNVRDEQDSISKWTSELKLIMIQCESVCRMRGTLTAGRPEYLVFHRLKVK